MNKILRLKSNISKIPVRISKYPRTVSLSVGFLVTVCFLLINDSGKNLYYDCLGYNAMAEEFIKEGIGNFKLTFEYEMETGARDFFWMRGYAWPFIMAILKTLGLQTHVGWCIWWAIFIVFGLVYLFPELIGRTFKKDIGIWGRLSVLFLTILIWPGLIIYPLSDLPALVLVFGALLLLYKALEMNSKLRYINIAVCGLLFGASYYIRTGNAVSICVAIIILILGEVRADRKWVNKISFIMLFFAGVFVAAVPQIIINTECIGEFTYKVPIIFTTQVVGSQLRKGVSFIRYETSIINGYPNPAVVSVDSMAYMIFKQEGFRRDGITVQELLLSIVKYPLEFLGIYAAKFANIIDARYGETYIVDWLKNRNFIILCNFSLWFLGVSGIVYQWREYRKEESKEWKNELLFFTEHVESLLCILAVIGPALLHLAGTHVEARYFYPGYILLWSYLFMVCPWKQFGGYIKKHVFSTVVIFVSLLGCVCSIWNFTFEKIPFHSYFVQDRPAVITELSDSGIIQGYDSSGIEGEVDEFSFDRNEKKMGIGGYCSWPDVDNRKIQKKLVLANEKAQYVYELNAVSRNDVIEKYGGNENYEYTGFDFSAYLFDLEAGEYHIYIVLENDDITKVFDTFCTVQW